MKPANQPPLQQAGLIRLSGLQGPRAREHEAGACWECLGRGEGGGAYDQGTLFECMEFEE